MPTFLIVIEPAPVQPARFLNRVAGMSAAPFGPCTHASRLQYAPHAYLAAVRPEDPGASIDEVKDAVEDALAHPWEISDTLEWQREVRRLTGVDIGDPRLTCLKVLNVDLRGQPLGLDLPFPAAPNWSLTMENPSRQNADAGLYPDEPDDLPEAHARQLAAAGEGWADFLADDDTALRDLSDEELALFSPRQGDDHGWPEEPHLPF